MAMDARWKVYVQDRRFDDNQISNMYLKLKWETVGRFSFDFRPMDGDESYMVPNNTLRIFWGDLHKLDGVIQRVDWDATQWCYHIYGADIRGLLLERVNTEPATVHSYTSDIQTSVMFDGCDFPTNIWTGSGENIGKYTFKYRVGIQNTVRTIGSGNLTPSIDTDTGVVTDFGENFVEDSVKNWIENRWMGGSFRLRSGKAKNAIVDVIGSSAKRVILGGTAIFPNSYIDTRYIPNAFPLDFGTDCGYDVGVDTRPGIWYGENGNYGVYNEGWSSTVEWVPPVNSPVNSELSATSEKRSLLDGQYRSPYIHFTNTHNGQGPQGFIPRDVRISSMQASPDYNDPVWDWYDGRQYQMERLCGVATTYNYITGNFLFNSSTKTSRYIGIFQHGVEIGGVERLSVNTSLMAPDSPHDTDIWVAVVNIPISPINAGSNLGTALSFQITEPFVDYLNFELLKFGVADFVAHVNPLSILIPDIRIGDAYEVIGKGINAALTPIPTVPAATIQKDRHVIQYNNTDDQSNHTTSITVRGSG